MFRKDESSCKRQKRPKRILFEVEIKEELNSRLSSKLLF